MVKAYLSVEVQIEPAESFGKGKFKNKKPALNEGGLDGGFLLKF